MDARNHDAMIDIRSLEFAYPGTDFYLRIPEFKIGRGEKVAVIGPSGSGKTTLLNLVAGILLPDTGRVSLDEQEISSIRDAARRELRITQIGFVFQDFELIEYLSVLDNVLHPCRISRALKLNEQARQRATDLLNRMGLGDKLSRGVEHLSQGEKQRVAICRALLPSPRLILADEATGNLDPRNKVHILDLLFKAVEDHDATLLAVTHDHELLPRFDRVVDFSHFLAGSAA
jgi:ABC-type lipoprotein export system ATPase subunit